MTTIEQLKALMGEAKVVAHHLTNCTDDPAECPFVADCEESMEARKDVAGDNWSWDDDAIPLRIADDCKFATVHGFEGQPQWNTADAIVNAGPVIIGLLDALPDLLAVAEAAQETCDKAEAELLASDAHQFTPQLVHFEKLLRALAKLTNQKADQ